MPILILAFHIVLKNMKETVSFLNHQRTSQSYKCQDPSIVPEMEKSDKSDQKSISLIEKILLSGLQNGDSNAFSNIFNAYYRDLVIFATRLTKELNQAEEIVQDTFVTLWEERESLKITTSLKSYLLKSVQNKYIDWFRHKKIVRMHSESVLEKPAQFALNTDSYLLYSELNEQIEKALRLLPEQVSETFRMNRNKGLKYHEIADILGISVRTVEVRIGKALHLLRNCLRDYSVITIFLLSLFI